MRHAIDVGEDAGRRIIHGVFELAMKRIILQRAAVDERAAVGQYHHSVAEHVPRHRLRDNRSSLWVPHSSLVIRLCRHVTRTGYDQDLPVFQKREVDRIDWHQIRQGCPAPLQVELFPK